MRLSWLRSRERSPKMRLGAICDGANAGTSEVQQSVALAQQIVQLEREIDAFRVETTRLQRENDALKASLERSKATLGQLTKPQCVVETLQSREREIDVMRAEIERLRAENEAARRLRARYSERGDKSRLSDGSKAGHHGDVWRCVCRNSSRHL